MADESPPAAGTPSQPGQPQFGVSSATGPTPNAGYEAAAMQRVGVVIRQLEQIVPLAGATSDLGKAVLKALNDLAKLIPPGTVTPVAERNTLDQLQMKNQQNQAMAQQMRQQPGGQPAAGGPPAGGQAAAPPRAA